jgi:hypothetical protein
LELILSILKFIFISSGNFPKRRFLIPISHHVQLPPQIMGIFLAEERIRLEDVTDIQINIKRTFTFEVLI